MAVDKRKQYRETRAHNRTLDMILLTVVVLLIATGGALWVTSGTISSADPTATPIALAIAATKAGSSSTQPTTTRESIPVAVPTLPASGGAPKLNQPAPDFNLKDLEGRQVSLSDYKGQVVLLNFWATWCGPCRKEIPDIRAVYNSYKDKGFAVIAVDIGETATVVSPFVKQFEMNFPVLLDSNMAVARQYEAFSIPTSLFLDRQGVIREIRIGAMPQSVIEQAVTKLLKEAAQ
jgi:peroxiredoxin